MKNQELINLNFDRLLQYKKGRPSLGSFKDEVWYAPPIEYTGFCKSCEENKFFKNSDYRLDLISHASDTTDYEELLGQLPNNTTFRLITVPIMFALESPGGDYGHGTTYDGTNKRPPLNTYYFVPNPKDLNYNWPINIEKLSYLYSPYFAYLMNKFNLNNVYITNVIKCGLTPKSDLQLTPFRGLKNPKRTEYMVRSNCYKEIFSKELKIFKPLIIFAFGSNTYKCLDFAKKDYPNISIRQLKHPKARMSKKDIDHYNNIEISAALKENNLI
jgi:hypothetical protein